MDQCRCQRYKPTVSTKSLKQEEGQWVRSGGGGRCCLWEWDPQQGTPLWGGGSQQAPGQGVAALGLPEGQGCSGTSLEQFSPHCGTRSTAARRGAAEHPVPVRAAALRSSLGDSHCRTETAIPHPRVWEPGAVTDVQEKALCKNLPVHQAK